MPDPVKVPAPPTGESSPPPLGVSLSAFILVGYMVMSLIGGISLVADGNVLPGSLTILVSAALIWVGVMLWRCHYAAWAVAVGTFVFLGVTWIVGSVVLGVPVALVYVPLFVAPLFLLFLPSARASVRGRER